MRDFFIQTFCREPATLAAVQLHKTPNKPVAVKVGQRVMQEMSSSGQQFATYGGLFSGDDWFSTTKKKKMVEGDSNERCCRQHSTFPVLISLAVPTCH